MSFLGSQSKWVWIALAVVGLLLVGLAIWLYRRKRPASTQSSVTLAKLFDSFLRRLPTNAADDPIVVVLGESLAGKTSFIRGAIDPVSGASLFLPSDTSDPRLQLFAGQSRIFEELSGDVLASVTQETRKSLQDLWRPSALRAPVAVLVVQAGSSTFTPAGLRQLGTTARGKIDALTELRGRPTRVRICLSNLDREAPGFVELATAIEDEGGAGTLRGLRVDTNTNLDELAPYLPLGLKKGPASAFAAMTDFVGNRGPALLSALKPLMGALEDTRGSTQPPIVDGVLLAAFSPDSAPIMLGDPLALDMREAEAETQALLRKRRNRMITALAVGAALSAAPYLYHRFVQISAASESVTTFTRQIQSNPGRFPPPDEVTKAEGRSAADLSAVLDPTWPPLRVSFTGTKEELQGEWLTGVRRAYLVPGLRADDRTKRVYAAALYYASTRPDEEGNIDPLGTRVLTDATLWSEKLGIPVGVVRDYVELNDPSSAALPDDIPVLPPTQSTVLEDWTRYLEAMAKYGATTTRDTETYDEAHQKELDALRADAKRLSAALTAAEEAQPVAEIVTLIDQKKWRAEALRRLIGDSPPSQEVPGWVLENEADITAVLGLAKDTPLDVPDPRGKALATVLSDLDAIKPVSVEKPEYVFKQSDADPIDVSATGFADRVAWFRASKLVATYLGGYQKWEHAENIAFFTQNPPYSSVGASPLADRGASRSLPGVFTQEAFEQDVVPAVSDLDGRLAKTYAGPEDKRRLGVFVDREVGLYATSMRDNLNAYYESFQFRASSTTTLRAFVNDMIAPSSWFSDFLVTVATSAGAAQNKDRRFQPLRDKLADFQSIVTLMAGENGKYPGLDKYTAILAKMLPSLDGGLSGVRAPKGTALADRLAPIGTLGFSILTGADDSPIAEVNAFLAAASIPSNRSAPFLAPVQRAYALGIENIEKNVAEGYEDDVLPELEPLLRRFPFDTSAKSDATAEEVEAALGAKGAYWKGFDAIVAPVCDKNASGKYSAKSGSGRTVRLPSGALGLHEWATKLAGVLWDKDGKAQPLAISAKPLPLPSMEPEETVTLSYLRTGTSSVYGFNQTPAYQMLAAPWSPGEPSSVGLELTTTGGGEKQFASIDVEGSDFAFLRLLTKAKTSRTVVYTWELTPGGSASKPYAISFSFASDPFAPFRPPSALGVR